MSYCTPVSVSVETRGLGFHPCPISSFLSLNLFQNRVFHPKEAFTRPFHQGHHALGTDPGFLLYRDSSSNTLHSSDIHRPSWLALPGQTISAFPHKPRAQLSGDNEPFVRLGGQSSPGWSLGISARWPPLPWLGYPPSRADQPAWASSGSHLGKTNPLPSLLRVLRLLGSIR